MSYSPYYQDGKKIYVSCGTRSLFTLQVVIVNKIYYNRSSYTTGSWFTKTTHYTFDDSYVDYNTIYSGYEFLSTYNRTHNPFAYTWNATNRVHDRVNKMREENRVYIN